MGRVEANFKQTEVGLIPEDWEVKSILSITNNIIDYRGVTPKKLGMDWGKGSIVALSAGNIKKGYIDFNSECYLGSEELYLRWMRNGDPRKDDIAFTMEAPLGNIALIPDDKKYILSQRAILLQIERNLYCPIYVFHYLISSNFQNYISAIATGSTAQGIKRKTFETLNISLPKDLSEQTAIANALSDADLYIESLEKLIDKKQKIKQGSLQQLLKPKPHWEVKKLGEIAEYKNGKTLEKFVVEDGEFFLITLNSIDIKGSLKTNHLTINRLDNFLERGDLVMVLSDVAHGNFLGLTDVIPEKNKYALNQRMGALKNLKEVLPKFLSYYINLHQAYFKSCGKGSSQQNLGKEDILSFDVYLPDRLEQECILNILSDMDNEIATLTQKLTKAKAIKQGMMQQLLTGKIRLI